MSESTDMADAVVEPAPASLRRLAIGGSAWTMGGFAGQQAIRLGSNLILTRLLFPEAFGLMALVAVVMQGLQMFSDVGIGPAIIQSHRGDERDFLNTAWTLQIIRGVLLWLIAAGASPLVAMVYGEPSLGVLIPVAAGSALLAGFNSTKLFTANRHLVMGRLTLIDLGSMLVGIVAMVAFAWAFRSVWALVVGGLVSTTAKLVASHTMLPGTSNRVRWDRATAREQLRFGRWIMLGSVTTFLAAQMDRLLFGRFLTMGEFGVYSIAVGLAMLPMGVVSAAGRIVLPSFSKVLNTGRDLGPVFHRVRVPILLLGGFIVAPLLLVGGEIIRLLYDQRYEGAGEVVPYLAAAVWLQVLECVIGGALIAFGRPVFPAIGNTLKLAAAGALIPVGFALGGLRGALVVLIAASLLKYLFGAVTLWRRGISCFAMDAAMTASFAVAYAATLLVGRGYDVESVEGVVRLLAELSLASGTFFLAAFGAAYALDAGIRGEVDRALRWRPRRVGVETPVPDRRAA